MTREVRLTEQRCVLHMGLIPCVLKMHRGVHVAQPLLARQLLLSPARELPDGADVGIPMCLPSPQASICSPGDPFPTPGEHLFA
ncbi:MAG: hypothetical protein ACK42I_04165, partial [Thermomicrobium sp.]